MILSIKDRRKSYKHNLIMRSRYLKSFNRCLSRQ
nr:MAG TPA: hypothetical protein [Caudoviricetes sp.]